MREQAGEGAGCGRSGWSQSWDERGTLRGKASVTPPGWCGIAWLLLLLACAVAPAAQAACPDLACVGDQSCVLPRPTPWEYACGVPYGDGASAVCFLAAGYPSESALQAVVQQSLASSLCDSTWQLPGDWREIGCFGAVETASDRVTGPYSCSAQSGSYTGAGYCYTGHGRVLGGCSPQSTVHLMNNWQRTRAAECPRGTVWNGQACDVVDVMPDKQPCCDNAQGSPPGVGYPVDPLTGNKLLRETDVSDPAGWLTFVRSYRSLQTLQRGYPAWTIGRGWRHTFERNLQVVGNGSQIFATRADGHVLVFGGAPGGPYVGDADTPERLLAVPAGGSAAFQLIDADASVETYDADGRLLTLASRGGFVTTLSYDGFGRLASVKAPTGRTLTFGYTAAADTSAAAFSAAMRIASVTLPSGERIAYAYANGNLASVTNADGSVESYTYTATGAYPNAALLTDVAYDGVAYTHYAYGGSDGVQVTNSTLVAAGATFGAFAYARAGSTLTTTFTTPLGQTETYSADISRGKARLRSVAAPCPLCGIGTLAAQAYDVLGYPAARTDFDGNTTCLRYDANGLELARTEGVRGNAACTAPLAGMRSLQTDWNAALRLPLERRVYAADGTLEARTDWVYNARGQVLARCEIDPADTTGYVCSATTAPSAMALVRRWTYRYCDAIGTGCPLVGLRLSEDGPRTEVIDVTNYSYYPSQDLSGCGTPGGACHFAGDLYQITNALGHVTTFVAYDKNGHIARLRDANGAVTDFGYGARGWLTSRTSRANADGTPNPRQDSAASLAYDITGAVTRSTLPDGATLTFGYDGAHRLTDVRDSAGDWIHYTLDAAGNRTGEETHDPGAAIKRTLARQYDALGRLGAVLNAAGQAVLTFANPPEAAPAGQSYAHGYDGNGNAVYRLDADGVGTEQQFDALGRLAVELQDHAGSGGTHDAATRFGYDARGHLRSVTDADGLVTNYTFDGLGNLKEIASPDSGSTRYTYNVAGARRVQIDARGVPTTYVYDALGRLTAITFGNHAADWTYAYDQPDATTGCAGSASIGRLTRIADASGSTVYCYDRRGNLVGKTQTTNGVALATGYSYDAADRLAAVSYPSGAVVSYTRDAAGRIAGVGYRAAGAAGSVPLVAAVSYYPFGPIDTITFANGRTLSTQYDADYAPIRVRGGGNGGLTLDTAIDARGLLRSASAAPSATPPTRRYDYDALRRLTAVRDGGGALLQAFGYSLAGDRLSKSDGVATSNYNYGKPPASHRLLDVDGLSRSYDASGNPTTLPVWFGGFYHAGAAFTYDLHGRLAGATLSANSVAFTYNGRGERVRKTSSLIGYGAHDTVYGYDESMQLIGEYGASGGVGAEYVYLDALPIAYVAGGTLYYIETDALGTPRQLVKPGATPAADAVVWNWDSFAPGAAFGENDPSGTVTFNLRFPGQYFDIETGLAYNLFRDYDAHTGRYIQSDPNGLVGGLDTYAYVENDPLDAIDPLGLWKIYGYWCGPNWTGGFRKPWFELTAWQQEHVHAPKSPLDEFCRTHDICYGKCGADNRCDMVKRSQCLIGCDHVLIDSAKRRGFWGNLVAAGIALGKPGKKPEEASPPYNPSDCPCGKGE